MSEKEEELLKEIVNYVKENKVMPTRRILQRKLNYKSVNSITQYIKSLENKNYLKRNLHNKLILDDSAMLYNYSLRTIKIINTNNYVNLVLNKNKNYIAFKIHNNYLNSSKIYKNDILIIEIKKSLKNNDIGLFIIDNKYRVMKYNYLDGFYILEDNEKLLLSKVIIIGKVIMIERKLWDNPKFLVIKHIIRSRS